MGKYDTCMREFLQNKERFADFFNGCCFQGEQVIRAEELQDASEMYIIENFPPEKPVAKGADAQGIIRASPKGKHSFSGTLKCISAQVQPCRYWLSKIRATLTTACRYDAWSMMPQNITSS